MSSYHKSGDLWCAKISLKESREMLQKWRENNTRCPEKVRDLWYHGLNKCDSIGDERWLIIEQVCVAAMDLYDSKLIKECLSLLNDKFPKSSRIRRLKIMANLEMRERYEDASNTYDDMIQKDESNPILYKRKIAIFIAQKKIPEAIKYLTEYLKQFMNDTEAWLELCSLYIQDQAYSRAAFCMEELILTNPHNHLFHQRYAEIQYTINTPESLEIARSYYSQALKLNPSNMRALYGLYLTCTVLANQPRSNSQKKKENVRVSTWAMTQITKSYQKHNEDDLSTVEAMFTSLQI
ncbi:ER membrane protein complex subunit 2-like [Brevipalpus obovatus]|uniref:ER membrane protein complex subunit 2-like n=1 Tax=Brevipalpus obovatus TaxID=246614 RepID=UPI003D9E0AA6